MKKASLLGHAAEVLDRIREGYRPADTILAEFFHDRRYLGARDRRDISGMVFGVLRNLRFLEGIVQAAIRSISGVHAVEGSSRLILAAYVLRVEEDSAVETPGLLTEFVTPLFGTEIPPGLIDSLVHTQLPEQILGSPVSRVAVQHSFPDCIIQEWAARFGIEETEALAASLNTQAPLSIRVNTLKATVDACMKDLEASGIQVSKGLCSPFALVLAKRVTLDTLHSYRDGLFEMQDEGSQLLSLLVDPQPGMTVIDACAGGGGKALHLAALMQNAGRLIAIDLDDRKLRHLQVRADRAGAKVHLILSAQRDEAAIARLRGKAHAVLVDAPCSAIGTVRRNPALKLSYTPERSEALSATQFKLLDSAALLVRPGGRLVYSTCTLLTKENEEVASRFLDSHAEFSLHSAPEILRRWGVDSDPSSAYLQLLPHRTGTDGFFAAVFVKDATA